MEQGSHNEIGILGTLLRSDEPVGGIGNEITMAQHDAFRSTSSPSRVEETGERVLSQPYAQLCLWCCAQQGFIFVGKADDTLDCLSQGARVTVGDEHTRARVLQSIAQLWL